MALGGLKERSAYVSRDSIQAAAEAAGLALKRPTLAAYLNQAVKQGIIHDAGRGWYSLLSERVKLDRQPVGKLVRLIEKKFPLLDFHCWSTAQATESDGPGGIPSNGAEGGIGRQNLGRGMDGLRNEPEAGSERNSRSGSNQPTSPF